MMSDMWEDVMEFRTGLTGPQPESNLAEPEPELTQAQRLDYPKSAMLDGAERVEQLCKSVAVAHFHVHICQQIENHIGQGEPLDLILRDAYYRAKFNLSPRAL